MESITMVAPCLFGIEGVLADELRRMGAEDVTPQNGRVLFHGPPAMLARANIGSRFAERIQIVLGSFRAQTFEELFQGVKNLPWEAYIGKADAFPVKGWSIQSRLFSVPDCQSIVKKAVVERLRQKYGGEWFSETGPVHQIQFSILDDTATLMLDTSGEGLHKRGYRARAGGAPIKETLAAAMADIARVRGYSRVVDPLCGSGTILIEAALIALRMAPGLGRSFAAERWGTFSPSAWREERARAKDLIIRQNEFEAVGCDIDTNIIELAEDNARKAGVADRIRFVRRPLADYAPPWEKGTLITNPPYGERLLDVAAAEELYRVMGHVFQPSPEFGYYVISPHEDFEALFGRPAVKRRKLYNGMIKCQLYMYFEKNHRKK